MPIPKPKSGEEKNKYISRCVSFLMHEKREQKQALAICFSVWEKNESTILDKIGIFIQEENISKYNHNQQKKIQDISNKVIDNEVGLEISKPFIHRNGYNIIVSSKHNGDKEEWRDSANTLIKELRRNGFKFELSSVHTKGFELESVDLNEASASVSTPMICNECDKKFKKKIGPKTYEVKCPKCRSYDTEPE